MNITQTDLNKPRQIEFVSGKAYAYTHRSPDKTSANEDSIALIAFNNDTGVMVVADGLGGLPTGSIASGIAVKCMEQVISVHDEESNVRDTILDGYEKANKKIIEKSNGSATTLAVVELQNNQIRTYHVGDSKIIVCGQRGKIKINTVSHSPVDYAVEAGMLDEHEAVHHEERHVISNMVGSTDMSITIGSAIKLAKYDTVLIASDGVFDNFYLDEIVDIIRKGSLANAAEILVSNINRRMTSDEADIPSHPDDHSFILFRLDQD